ncbi:hypothetical protein GUI12_04235 [Anaplasmataceae bacterium AB001_6]|nr:hypothetical protein GUI12_04235 [Anaplasmataceae bacterium AB001_6]
MTHNLHNLDVVTGISSSHLDDAKISCEVTAGKGGIDDHLPDFFKNLQENDKLSHLIYIDAKIKNLESDLERNTHFLIEILTKLKKLEEKYEKLTESSEQQKQLNDFIQKNYLETTLVQKIETKFVKSLKWLGAAFFSLLTIGGILKITSYITEFIFKKKPSILGKDD